MGCFTTRCSMKKKEQQHVRSLTSRRVTTRHVLLIEFEFEIGLMLCALLEELIFCMAVHCIALGVRVNSRVHLGVFRASREFFHHVSVASLHSPTRPLYLEYKQRREATRKRHNRKQNTLTL